MALRQSDEIALPICEGSTAPLSGSADLITVTCGKFFDPIAAVEWAGPSRTSLVSRMTETEICGGGGGGVPELAPPPAQPGRARRLSSRKRAGESCFRSWCRERRRMLAEKQARCQLCAIGFRGGEH